MTRSHNDSTTIKIVKASQSEDTYIAALPKALRNFILFESIVFYDPRTVYKLYRKHGTDPVLRAMQRQNKKQTSIAYGLSHPEAM